MDPFSLITGSITICQLAGKVVMLGVSYGKSLPAEVQTLVSEIALLSGILTTFNGVLEAEEEERKARIINSAMLQGSIEECKTQLTELHGYLERHQSAGNKFRGMGKSLKWPFKKSETMEWIAKIERYKSTFSLALRLEDIGLSRKISKYVEEIRRAQEVDRIAKRREKQNKKYRGLLVWMAPASPRQNHIAAQGLRREGTGLWFMTSREFRDWKDASSSFLWLYGSAGTGKTILSSIIIDHLQRRCPDVQIATLYFYCDFKDTTKVEPVNVYGSLIAQVLEAYSEEVPEHIQAYYEKNSERRPEGDVLKDQLLWLLKRVGRTRIVIDALDECPRSLRIEMLNSLLEIQRDTNTNLLVTSRGEFDIKFALEDYDRVLVSEDVNSTDITLFVREEIERNVRLRQLKSVTKAKILDTLSAEAKGMFRWVKCVLDQIARLRNDKAIKAALESLPPGLTETYERILNGIATEDRQFALRVIHWLVCSCRPMRIQELVEAIAIELDAVCFEADTLLNDPEDLLDICGSLITFDQDRKTVGLAHFSVKEFFVSRERLATLHNDFFVDVVQTNFEIAKFCITYLCYEDFSKGPCSSSQELLDRIEAYSLFLYSSLYWTEHARGHASMEDQSFLCVMERFFLSSQMKPNFLAWMQAYEGLRDKYPRSSLKTNSGYYLYGDVKGDNRLIYACRLGLHSVAKLLLSKGYNPNATCTSEPPNKYSSLCFAYGHAVHAACRSRDLNMVKLILEAGGDVNAIAGEFELPICAAIHSASEEHLEILEYLLEKGADVNLVTTKREWALNAAIGGHNISVIKICLRAGADLSIRDKYDRTVFESAAIYGKEEFFNLLLEHGGAKHIHEEFALKSTSSPEGYALYLASQNNFFETAERILQRDGSVLFQDSSLTALMNYTFISCARQGFYRFLQNMLKYSGDDWQFSSHTQCLQLACSQGYIQTVKALLAVKNMNTSPEILTDLLVLAAGRGHKGVVEKLIDYGVAPENPDQHGWTALLAASVHHQHSAIGLLNQRRNTEGDLGDNALKPTSWREWTPSGQVGFQHARLICAGLEAYMPPGEAAKWITTDHPLPISDTYRYFEVHILSIGKTDIDIGLCSALCHHDASLSPVYCSSSGYVRTPGFRYEGFPTFSVGSVVGVLIDRGRNLAWFTLDGEVITTLSDEDGAYNSSVTNVKGMVYPTVWMSGGVKIKANFGEEPFVTTDQALQVVLAEEKTTKGKYTFLTEEYEDDMDRMVDFTDKRFVG